ncbi:hypothetical protein [Zunongwangia sp. HGR-M22]|uniref:hypothetical protein n=1 Tax=Zunongwangia sp. HGR-M22 TaxID=3015168 RepID=UPI0022DD4EE3|nr:hypothetical protein [Zunongwangia sp. HGR-M22]WBL26912.1 hypothetical protein PBT91_06500 [Zunongwangia sp. HGR-M22]
MKRLLAILFIIGFNAIALAQENPENNIVNLKMEDHSIAPALTELSPNQFLQYDPNLPSGTFIGVQNEREEFDMVGIIEKENRQREMAKAKRLANISLPQTQRKKEKVFQLTGNNQEQNQLNTGISNFNNTTNSSNPFYQYHNALYNNSMRGYYSQPYRTNRRYYY